MNPEDVRKFSVDGVNYTVTYKNTGWRKRQIVEQTLKELHETQLQMIDEAVDRSDLRQAKEIINYIKSK